MRKKIDKAQAPAPQKLSKALPKPDEKARKKRGGKRVRKQKQDLALSEAAKAANRMTFAEIGQDVFQDDMGQDLGQYGKSGSHSLRMQETKKS